MKLTAQLPCFNEEHTLPHPVSDIPRRIEVVDPVEALTIDDAPPTGGLRS